MPASVARGFCDERQRGKANHHFVDILSQRVFAIALSSEDVNDHAALRHDMALQAVMERDWAWHIHSAMVDNFISSYSHPPKVLILGFDATDDRMHGKQEGRFFHGYRQTTCPAAQPDDQAHWKL